MTDDYQRFVARLDYPVYVVTTTAADDGERSGCLAGFVMQCSIDPPRHAIWISEKNHTHGVVARARGVVVHALGDNDGDRRLAELFGGESGDTVDKFAACEWHEGPIGLPVVDGTAGWFAARIVKRLPRTGDHAGIVVEPVAAWVPAVDDGDEPDLGFQAAKSIDPGHRP